MTVIFTCGHRAKNDNEMGHTLTTKTYTGDNNRAVDTRTVCNNCYHVYEVEDFILYGEAAVAKWLDGE